MNEASAVVGFWDDELNIWHRDISHPYIWTEDLGRVDLPTWTDANGQPASGRAMGVNSSGTIVGIVNGHAVIWEAVPEPSCLLALLCGLGGVAGLARWRIRR